MSRSSRLTANIRILTAAVGTAALAMILSCSDSITDPQKSSSSISPDGVVLLEFHYPDSIKNPVEESASRMAAPSGISADLVAAPSASLSSADPLPAYLVTQVPFAPEAAPGSSAKQGPNCDDCLMQNVPLGFSFNFYGNVYSTIHLGSNGIVGFGATNGLANIGDGCCAGRFIHKKDVNNNLIALGWSDWFPTAAAGIRYETRGTAPFRRFVLQYNNVPESSGNGRMTVQLVLYESSNDIVIYTSTLSTTVARHTLTQGLENLPATEAAFVAGRDSSRFALANDGVKYSVNAVNKQPIVTPTPGIVVTTNPGACAANVSVATASVEDDAAGWSLSAVRSDGLALDAAYPKGVTTITWTATDAEGLKANASQTVTVSDAEKPSVTAPADIAVRTNVNISFATVAVGSATAADNCPDVKVAGSRVDAPIEAGYPLGVTTVTWTATDAAGNTASASQKVTVTPNKAPVLSVSPTIVVNTDPGACSANVSLVAATATDDLDGTVVSGSRNDGLPLSAAYPKGTTMITWKATDIEHLESSAVQAVIVADNEKPSLSMPENKVVRVNPWISSINIEVGNASAADNCGEPSVSGVRSDYAPLYNAYPVGVTKITWTAVDAAGNSISGVQTVDVHVNQPPVLHLPANLSVNTDPGACYANVSVGSASATDDTDGTVVSSLRSDGRPLDASYPKGVTNIVWKALDSEGLSSEAVQSITVSDKQRPSVMAPASVSVETAPGANWASVSVGVARGEDNCGDVSVSGARSDGALLSAAYPVGVTSIAWTAIDGSGNSASAVQTVTVVDHEAPVIGVPADLRVNATSPRGAVVNYAASVSFSDNVGVVSSGCSPVSGSSMSIGPTSVSCTAVDAAGNRASKSFVVTVVGAHEQIGNLIDFMSGLSLSNGVANPLMNQLQAAYRASDGTSTNVSCVKMADFLKKISLSRVLLGAYSPQMIADANRIMAVLGCQ